MKTITASTPNSTSRNFQARLGAVMIMAAVALMTTTLNADQPVLTTSYAKWETSYAKAVEKSNKTGRPIMLVFSGSDWCSYCTMLAEEVFTTHEFARWSTDNVIKVEVDFPQSYELPPGLNQQNQNLKAQFGHHVQSYPTVLFVDAEGKLLGKTGYVAGGPNPWLDRAQAIVPTQVKADLLATTK